MKLSIALLGTLALVGACSRERAPETGSTTVTGAPTGEARSVTVEEIRLAILDQNPGAADALTSVVITSDGDVVTLRGTVPDENTRTTMVDRVKRMPNVKSVRDELTVAPRAGGMQGAPPGTTEAQPMDQPGKGGTETTQGSTKTKRTDAIRSTMMKDKAAPASIVNGLVITDDGSMIVVSGTVPDHATHAAVMKSAKKAAGNQPVQDNLQVTER